MDKADETTTSFWRSVALLLMGGLAGAFLAGMAVSMAFGSLKNEVNAQRLVNEYQGEQLQEIRSNQTYHDRRIQKNLAKGERQEFEVGSIQADRRDMQEYIDTKFAEVQEELKLISSMMADHLLRHPATFRSEYFGLQPGPFETVVNERK